MTPLQNKIEEAKKRFDEKFLYWVVLGSTLNDGSELRWNVGEGKMPSIEKIKSFLEQELSSIATLAQEEALIDLKKMAYIGDNNHIKQIDENMLEKYAKSKGITLSNNTLQWSTQNKQ